MNAPDTRTYQSHGKPGEGMTDSFRRLERLHLPKDLAGKAVLDIGCNEGFFCNIAAERGARRVVGIDFVASAVEFARSTYSNPAIEFLHQSWATLPEGPFDWILWTSAMHYERNPKAVFERIAAVMAPGATLVLECGVAPGSQREMVMSQRHDATLWHPTMPHLIRNLLVDFAVRDVAPLEPIGTDPISRMVFHAKTRLPTIIVINGQSGQGKSSAMEALREAATQCISVDLWFHKIMTSKHHHDPVSHLVRDYKNPLGLSQLYLDIDDAGLTDTFAELLTKGIGGNDRVAVIDGALTEKQVDALAKAVKGRALVWSMQRRQAG